MAVMLLEAFCKHAFFAGSNDDDIIFLTDIAIKCLTICANKYRLNSANNPSSSLFITLAT